MLDPLYEAVAWVLIKIHAGLSTFLDPNGGAAWGLSIVLLTVCVRLLIFPLFVKQINSSRKMQELQPKVQELRKKYKNDKQKLNQETVKLYQESGANPLGGCLPLLVQFPIFISLFNVLRTVAEGKPLYGFTQDLVDSAREAMIFHAPLAAHFFSTPEQLAELNADPVMARIVIGCVVAISSVTTFLTVRQSVTRSIKQMPDNPMASQQKILMYLSPAFALFGLTLPIGVLIYWLTTNLWSLGQQHLVYRKYPLPGADDADNGNGNGKGGGGGGGGKSSGPSTPSGGGLFRKKREEPAPEPVEEPKIVRRQPVKQSRSKRSGKR